MLSLGRVLPQIGSIISMSRLARLFGYSLEDLPDLKNMVCPCFPDPSYYQQVIEPRVRDYLENVPVEGLSTRMFCKDGSVKNVRISFSIVADKRLWYFNDITDYWIAEKGCVRVVKCWKW